MQNVFQERVLSDSEIARIEQERLYSEEPIDLSMSTLINSSVESDHELAAKLQAEEYSKPSFAIPRARPNSSSDTLRRPVPTARADEAIAAHLQAQEDHNQRRLIARQQRRQQPPRSPAERIVLPPALQRFGPVPMVVQDFTPNDYEVN